MCWRWHVDSSNDSLVTCHFFLTPFPSSLVNTSMRMRRIYKRESRGPYGVANCQAGVACPNSAHSIHFACLCFLFPFFSPLRLPSRMASFCGRCSRKNKSQGLNGGKVLFLKSSAKQRGGSRCKCQWTRWLWGWSLNSGALPRPFASVLFLPFCFILQFHFILPSPCRPSSFTLCWLPLKFVECNVDILRFF